MIDTTWWENKNAATFLAPNWDHPSRAIGTSAALNMVGRGLLVEVGPGNGIDYARAFRLRVLKGTMEYAGWEATASFCRRLRAAYPEATWNNAPLQQLLPASCDVLYARAVLEHQPHPLAALAICCAAARVGLVIDWYRPPAATASCDWCGPVPCHTVERTAAMNVLTAHGCTLRQTYAVGGNEVWIIDYTDEETP